MTFSYEPLHIDVLVFADQKELTYNSSVQIQDEVWRNGWEQGMIGADGERESAAWLDDDEVNQIEKIFYYNHIIFLWTFAIVTEIVCIFLCRFFSVKSASIISGFNHIVIVIVMDLVTPGQILVETVHFFTSPKYPWVRYKSNYSLSSYEWILEQTVLFNLGMAMGQREEKF